MFTEPIIINTPMDYIVSKPNMPSDASDVQSGQWFNIWSKLNWPYQELIPGDILYFYDTKRKCLSWKTRVIALTRYRYEDKNELWEKYGKFMQRKYFDSKPDKGYFLHYQITVLEKINIPKPSYNFKRLGWEEMDNENLQRWFSFSTVENNVTIDEIVDTTNMSLQQALTEVNNLMRDISPKKVNQIVKATIRKDARIVRLIKQAANFKCQFPSCGIQIKTKDGFYIEVAHIEPVKNDGKSVLGNLLVLCPNHHKEFDHGDLVIINQTQTELSGVLNGNKFEINLVTV